MVLIKDLMKYVEENLENLINFMKENNLTKDDVGEHQEKLCHMVKKIFKAVMLKIHH